MFYLFPHILKSTTHHLTTFRSVWSGGLRLSRFDNASTLIEHNYACSYPAVRTSIALLPLCGGHKDGWLRPYRKSYTPLVTTPIYSIPFRCRFIAPIRSSFDWYWQFLHLNVCSFLFRFAFSTCPHLGQVWEVYYLLSIHFSFVFKHLTELIESPRNRDIAIFYSHFFSCRTNAFQIF